MGDITGDMNTSYKNLITDIDRTINENERLFKEMRETNYGKSSDYESDLKDYKINKEVTNVNETRQQLWEALDKKYNDNTKLRKFYFNELVNLDLQLKKQNEQLKKLIDEVNTMETTNSTIIRNIKKDKYNMNKYVYFRTMYRVLIFIQLMCVVFLLIGLAEILPKYTMLVIVFILLLACLGFMFYYTFIGNAGRDKFSWDRFAPRDINRNGYGTGSCNKVTKRPIKKNEEQVQLEGEVDKIIADSKKKGAEQCKK
jgi:hypothetical protein